jgi:hypothetical protein
VLRLLVPPSLRLETGGLVELKSRIERAIESSRAAEPAFECEFDSAREKIQLVLRDYGCRLPETEGAADRDGWGDGK